VDLPEDMKRAMAKQAEAERERRAKVISAEGEYQASEKLAQAAEVIGSTRVGVMLRMLQTLSEIAVEKNSTIVFPLPMEILRYFDVKERGKMKQVLKGLLVVGFAGGSHIWSPVHGGYSHSSGNVTTPSQLDWEHYFQEIMKQVTGPGKATPYRPTQ